MPRHKQTAEASQTDFITQPNFEIDGFEIAAGDFIKVKGEYGSTFKVRGLTTNTKTGAVWVDCFEVIRGVPSAFRAFQLDRIKRVPRRGKRGKRVS